MRRAIALGSLVVVVLLIALGIHSCDTSSTQSALQNYTSNVSSLIAQSNQNGRSLFADLASAGGAANPTQAQSEVNQTLSSAESILHQAQAMSVPAQVKTGNQDLLLALRMRVDGIAAIASEIQPALRTTSSLSAVDAIAEQPARFYASDVLYKLYAAPAIAGAVNHAGVRFGGLNGGQFLPSLQWLMPSYIASVLHVSVPGVQTKIAPGLHGHQLNSVSVAGTTLQTGSTNAIPATPAPTFTLNFANTGDNNETNVVCKVSVTGTGVSGQTTVPETTAHQNATCQVTLTSTPPTGTHTVVATIEKVPGEKNLSNNTLSFPVTFQ